MWSVFGWIRGHRSVGGGWLAVAIAGEGWLADLILDAMVVAGVVRAPILAMHVSPAYEDVEAFAFLSRRADVEHLEGEVHVLRQ